MASLSRQLEELNLLNCSLLQGEDLTFIPPSSDAEIWQALLEAYPDFDADTSPTPQSAAKFQLRCSGVDVWFEVQLPADYEGQSEHPLDAMVAVRGDQITRAEQERWQKFVTECISEIQGSECVLPYNSYPRDVLTCHG